MTLRFIDEPDAAAPIGVFDSGVGGLTVLAALRHQLPQENFIYLGDTARLPYGTKSPETVVRYALQSSALLIDAGVKALIVACNTASAVALPTLRERFAPIPVIGVIEPGAQAAVRASRTSCIAVLATEGTVQGGAYQREILRLAPKAQVKAAAGQILVSLAEEGWTEGPLAESIAQRYLVSLLTPQTDVLVLGCTHFPLLSVTLAQVAGPRVQLVDSARTTAKTTAIILLEKNLLALNERPYTKFWVTDAPERFARVGGRFLGESIDSASLRWVDLQNQTGKL